MAAPNFIIPVLNDVSHADMRTLFGKRGAEGAPRPEEARPLPLASYLSFPSLDKLLSKVVSTYINDSNKYQKLYASKAKNQNEFTSFTIEIKSRFPFSETPIAEHKNSIISLIKKETIEKLEREIDELKIKLADPCKSLILELYPYVDDNFQKEIFYSIDRSAFLSEFHKRIRVAHDTHRLKVKEKSEKEKKEEGKRAVEMAQEQELFARLGEDPALAKKTIISLIDERIKNSKEPAKGRQDTPNPLKAKPKPENPKPKPNQRGRGRGRGRGEQRGRGRGARGKALKAKPVIEGEEQKEKRKEEKKGKGKEKERGRDKGRGRRGNANA